MLNRALNVHNHKSSYYAKYILLSLHCVIICNQFCIDPFIQLFITLVDVKQNIKYIQSQTIKQNKHKKNNEIQKQVLSAN